MKCPVCNHADDIRGGTGDHRPGCGWCWQNLGGVELSPKLVADIIGRFMPYFEAVTSRHNGYDPLVPGIEEPETPKQAIQDLLDEERSLADIEMRIKIEKALDYMDQGLPVTAKIVLREILENG